MTATSEPWKRCSTCKREIDFEHPYWTCSVSTCNRKRGGLVFCSVRCWDAHLGFANHRDAWAEEARSPTRTEYIAELAAPEGARRGRRRKVVPPGMERADAPPREVLVVVSKLKRYVKEQHEMNTSDNVMPVLSDALRELADEAARIARQHARKTVLDRDVRAALSGDDGEY